MLSEQWPYLWCIMRNILEHTIVEVAWRWIGDELSCRFAKAVPGVAVVRSSADAPWQLTSSADLLGSARLDRGISPEHQSSLGSQISSNISLSVIILRFPAGTVWGHGVGHGYDR